MNSYRSYKIVPNDKKYYMFIRRLRLDPNNSNGFINQAHITKKDQNLYMAQYSSCYHICLLNDSIPIGYVGVIDNDIRICVDHKYKGQGVGSYMLQYVKETYPSATGKILKDNKASQLLFDKIGIPYIII